ncbi:nucleotide-diphospho-sugar transferase [Mucilaginibacter jinjuensis]|uniref:Nucleotide-diphospho-sugar transferase n=1 Tax=Mucilaginibacter jinjuensis TaxID=1176721 RepID=A0ABY7T903_9SPHI|nr:nucleotide-diphospho-sugar transferase [Mucilaginibacter jinjuensis]WCT12739.1 nucleotide-diphospho-sugar transferase [Mucilaginibacter jinjuensis]
MNYKTHSPVLLLLFNRPDTTRRVFEAIRLAAPARLYIAADGPRKDREQEAVLCVEAKEVVNHIDWPCEVKTLFREQNLGCKEAVSSAIDWFFEQEEEGIILEDDCLPSNDFFRFCDQMLERYRFDTRIRHIGGSNLQQGKQWGEASYYCSNLTHVWGWASWRRVWQQYDKELTAYTAEDVQNAFANIFTEPIIVNTWVQMFKQLNAGQIDTWDYQLTFINFFNNSLSIIPNVNLISNIGFGDGATHTIDAANRYASLPHQPLGNIVHPLYIVPQKQADYNTLAYDFDVERIKRKNAKLHRRIKRWFKNKR